ncbi:MAG: hypothetical protein IPI90_20235 [Saprospiraceae bacterium]|nr:hypothetical protein [Candidatus Vicinibacter affinis]
MQVEIPNVPGKYLNLETCTMTPCPPGTYCPGATTEPIPALQANIKTLKDKLSHFMFGGTFRRLSDPPL